MPRRASALLAALVTLLGLLLAQGCGGDGSTPQSAASQTSSGDGDPVSGLRWVDASDLPGQAQQTLRLIDAGGPFPYSKDGSHFGNYEHLLPEHRSDYYREYTVETPGSDDRGARRLIAGEAGEIYYTDDHYNTFERVRR